MRLRAMLLLPSVGIALMGAGVPAASAATLWTSASHVVRVTVGATATSTGTNVVLTSGTAVINHCDFATLNMTLQQNNDAGIVFAVTSSSWSPACTPGTPVGTHVTPWSVTVSGTSFVSGTSTCWNGAVDRVVFDLLGGSYSGNLTFGVRACQPTAAGVPVTLQTLAAGTVVGPLTGDGRIDGSFAFTGTAAAYSLTN